jgi:hypothetical protein
VRTPKTQLNECRIDDSDCNITATQSGALRELRLLAPSDPVSPSYFRTKSSNNCASCGGRSPGARGRSEHHDQQEQNDDAVYVHRSLQNQLPPLNGPRRLAMVWPPNPLNPPRDQRTRSSSWASGKLNSSLTILLLSTKKTAWWRLIPSRPKPRSIEIMSRSATRCLSAAQICAATWSGVSQLTKGRLEALLGCVAHICFSRLSPNHDLF